MTPFLQLSMTSPQQRCKWREHFLITESILIIPKNPKLDFYCETFPVVANFLMRTLSILGVEKGKGVRRGGRGRRRRGDILVSSAIELAADSYGLRNN